MGMLLFVVFPFFLSAQEFTDPVSFSVSNAPDTVKAGEVFTVAIDATIEGEKWHLYSAKNDPDAGPYPTQFTAKSDNFVIAGETDETKADIEYDPNFEVELGWHTLDAVFYIPAAVKQELSGEQQLDIEVLYQVCDDRVCLPPTRKTLSTVVQVSGVADQPFESGVTANEDKTVAKTAGTSDWSSGIFSFFWLAMTAGFAALLTPCVFPMIPLTVSFFSKQSENSNGEKPVGKALLFGFSIVLTFTILGVLLAAIIGAAGANQFAANPWVNIFIGVVLIAFGFSLLGMYELRLPHQLTNWLNQKSDEKSGVMGILFMALTISAVSFSCTAPFVGGVLAATAGGEWFNPIIGMVGFSAAFASPFVIFAMFPSWLESLPQSGSWMNIVKVLLGFVELAAALKFISNADLVWQWGIVSRPLAIAAWIAIFLIAGLYLLGTFALKHEQKPEVIGTGRLLLAIPFLLFSFYLIPGLLGASLGIWDSWLPPKQPTDVSVVASLSNTGTGLSSSEEGWSEDFQASVEKAKQENKPVFIDFTGYTCTNCRAMETNVFPRQEIQERFEDMVLVRLYTDGGTNASENQQMQFELTGNIALPTYVILNPDTQQVIEQLLGYAKEEKFISFLDTGIQKYQSRK